MRRSVPMRILMAVILAVVTGGLVHAQIPDKFTNLQILPKEIGRRELVEIMRNFSGGLGVRCRHCHVGESPDTLEGYDFASDEKETKKVARAMMKMTREINERLLPATGRDSIIEVRCVTCHRGLDKPQTLDRILIAAAKEKGTEESLKLYRDMHEKYRDQGVFDFGPSTLGSVAEALAQGGKDIAGAIMVMTFNAEEHPQNANVQMMLGGLYRSKGDREAAIACFERALVLDPESAWAKKQLQALKEDRGSE